MALIHSTAAEIKARRKEYKAFETEAARITNLIWPFVRPHRMEVRAGVLYMLMCKISGQRIVRPRKKKVARKKRV